MKYTFHPHAEKELDKTENYYHDISEELGDRFREDIETTISRIRKFPRAYQLVSRIHRRCRLSDFPYGIVYRLKPNEIRVLAVMHLHREQDYWIHRT
jgi:plasmid stabilization system protein ParE